MKVYNAQSQCPKDIGAEHQSKAGYSTEEERGLEEGMQLQRSINSNCTYTYDDAFAAVRQLASVSMDRAATVVPHPPHPHPSTLNACE